MKIPAAVPPLRCTRQADTHPSEFPARALRQPCNPQQARRRPCSRAGPSARSRRDCRDDAHRFVDHAGDLPIVALAFVHDGIGLDHFSIELEQARRLFGRVLRQGDRRANLRGPRIGQFRQSRCSTAATFISIAPRSSADRRGHGPVRMRRVRWRRRDPCLPASRRGTS